MSEKRRRRKRQTIDLEQLKNDPNSFLSWDIDDSTLRKLETYRLYRVGYAATDIAEALGFARSYLYELWDNLEVKGVEALVDKRWGAAPRKRTTEREAAVLRAKALNPERGDADLAEEFGMDRSTVYHLLKEHELQDLHRVLGGTTAGAAENPPPEAEAGDGEKGGAKLSPVDRRSS
jgi:transposase